MDNTVVRQKYSNRPAEFRTRSKGNSGNKQLGTIIARQLLISILLLALVVTARNIDIPAGRAVNNSINYVLTYDIKMDTLTSGVKKLAADIKYSITPDNNTKSTNKSAQTEQQDSGAALSTGSSNRTEASVQGTASNGSGADETQTPSDTEASNEVRTSNETLTSSKTQTSSFAQTSDTPEEYTIPSSDEAAEQENKVEYTDETTMPESSVLSAAINRFNGEYSMLLPVEGTVSTLFGTVTKSGVIHKGIDIDIGNDKDSNVKAVLDGVIEDTGRSREYGSYVRVKHSDGLETIYAHCSTIAVGKGKAVRKGDTIASIGNTGADIGSHLHFEVWKGNEPVDPLEYVSVPIN